MIDGPILANIDFFMPLPSSWSAKKKSSHIGQPHSFKPDLDNLIKFICDCATGIAYEDDSQIYFIKAKKEYDVEPRTEFTVWGMTP